MKIYNEDKTKELLLSDCDLEMGYLTDYTEEVYHEAVEHVEEQGHYEVIREYPSGGKDVEWIVDVPKVEGREAYTEIIHYQTYASYPEHILLQKEYQKQVEQLKQRLTDTDFQAIKYAEGLYTEDEYAIIRNQRQEWRDLINDLNKKIRALDYQNK